MTKRFLLGMSAILSTVMAVPVSAQVVMAEPHAYVLHLANAETEIGSAPHQQRDVSIVNTVDAKPSIRPWKAGNETATMPWSAPMGHHQPTAVDVVGSGSRLSFDQEDANVDRIVRGICRGC